jgi:predicted transcriptional regulator
LALQQTPASLLADDSRRGPNKAASDTSVYERRSWSRYHWDMAEDVSDPNEFDFFVSTDEVEVDHETAAAIERGIKAADQGDVYTSDEVRQLIPQWIAKFAAQRPR